MCKFASFVLTKDKEFWGPTESHSDIIERHKIHEDGCRGPNIVRVEITPPEEGDLRQLDKWTFVVDQDRFPEWYDAELVEQRARTALLRRSQEERWFLVEEGDGSTVGYSGTATAGHLGTATAGARGTATAGARGTATAGDSGTATAGDSGILSVKYWDNKSDRYRLCVAYVGEDGIKPDTRYRYDVDAGKLVEANE